MQTKIRVGERRKYNTHRVSSNMVWYTAEGVIPIGTRPRMSLRFESRTKRKCEVDSKNESGGRLWSRTTQCIKPDSRYFGVKLVFSKRHVTVLVIDGVAILIYCWNILWESWKVFLRKRRWMRVRRITGILSSKISSKVM